MKKKKAKTKQKRVRTPRFTQAMVDRYMWLWTNHETISNEEKDEYIKLDDMLVAVGRENISWALAAWKGKCVDCNDLEMGHKAMTTSRDDLKKAFDSSSFWSKHYERESIKFNSLLVEAQAQIGRLTMQLSRHRHVADISDKNSELPPVWNKNLQRGEQLSSSDNGKSAPL